jgi:hypothetical protein
MDVWHALGLIDEFAQSLASYIEALQISYVSLSDKEDQLIFSPNLTDIYSPKWGYKALIYEQRDPPLPWWGKSTWKLKCIAK